MSRTLRGFARRRSRSVNRYRSYSFNDSRHLLKNPPPRVFTDRVYEKETVVDTRSWKKIVPKGTPLAIEENNNDPDGWWCRHWQKDDKRREVPNPVRGDWYVKVVYTVENTNRKRIWSPCMRFMDGRADHLEIDEEALDLWQAYLEIHKLVHRNRTSYRQRIKAIRRDKKKASQITRRRASQALRKMIEWPEEDMPSQSYRPRCPTREMVVDWGTNRRDV